MPPSKKKKPTPTKKKPAGAARVPPSKKKKPTPTKKKPVGAARVPPSKKKKKPAEKEAPPEAVEPPTRKGAVAPGPEDEVYRRAVSVAMERGAASSVLLSRRLGIGYAQARALIERLVEDGVLGEMAPSGSRPLLLTEEEWEERIG